MLPSNLYKEFTEDVGDKVEDKVEAVFEPTYCLPKYLEEVPETKQNGSQFEKTIGGVLLNKENTDVKIVFNGGSYNCHKTVLRSFSDMLEEYMRNGLLFQTYKVTNKVDSKAFQLLYDWMLKDQVECTRNELLDLLEMASFLFVPGAVASIFQCMNDKEYFDEIQCTNTFFEARAKNKEGVADLMLTSVRKYFLLLISTDHFRSMDARSVCKLLASNNLAVQSEVEIFYSALLWILGDYEGRKSMTSQLFASVRFVQLPPTFLLHIGIKLHELLEEIADALYPFILKAQLHQQEMDLLNNNHCEETLRNRLWIRDPECPYLNKIRDNRFITHDDFVNYVESLDCAEDFLNRIEEVRAYKEIGEEENLYETENSNKLY